MTEDKKAPIEKTQEVQEPEVQAPTEVDAIVAETHEQAQDIPEEYASTDDFLEDTFDAVLRGKRVKLRPLGHLELLEMNIGYIEMLTWLDDIPEESLAADPNAQKKLLEFYGPIVCVAMTSINVVNKPQCECAKGELSIKSLGFDEVCTLGILVISKSKSHKAVKEVIQKVAPLSEGDASETSTES